MLACGSVAVRRIRSIRKDQIEPRAQCDHRVLKLGIPKLIESGMHGSACILPVLQHVSKLDAEITFQKGAELRIGTRLELRLKFRGRELLFFEVTRDELRQDKPAVENTTEISTRVTRQRRPCGPPARGAFFVRPSAAHIHHSGNPVANLVTYVRGVSRPVEALKRPFV